MSNRPATDVRADGGAIDRISVWWLALALFVAHVVVNRSSAFEFQRDEFLYLAMGDHLRWWHMDFPPFIALLANVTRAIAGDSLVAIRIGPAIAASLLVVAAARAARMLGGSTAAQWLAALAIVVAPVVLRPGMLFQPVIFDQLWWTCALLALIQRQRSDDARWWMAVGVSLGLGLLTKFSIAFIGIGIVAGVLSTPLRRDLLTRWPWLALLIALAIGSASLLGQVNLHFPIIWQMRDLNAGQLGRRGVTAFVSEQPLLPGPVAFAMAVVGWIWMSWGNRASTTRAAAIAMLVSWLLLSWNRGKGYYGAPVYPLLIAAGAVAMSQLSPVRLRRVLIAVTALLLVTLSAIVLPLVLPVQSPPATAQYAKRLGLDVATRTNYGTSLQLPQDFADMLGWEALVRATADEWSKLPDNDRARAVITARNYGEAGALDHYGPRYGLPRVVSGAGSYWFFGPGDLPGDVMISLGERMNVLMQLYSECHLQRVVGTVWAVDEEQRVPITLCRGPRQSLQAVWPSFDPAR